MVSRKLLLESTITEKKVSEVVYVSETYLRNQYNKFFGMPPKKYIKTVKLKKAHTLLRTTDLNVSRIAQEIGYINTSKFSSDFKRRFGITPTQYRKNIKNVSF